MIEGFPGNKINVIICYLELIRNTPLLIQLFFIYFVIGPILEIDRFTSAVLALSLFEGAYASEIFRAGILSIHRGQWKHAFLSAMLTVAIFKGAYIAEIIRAGIQSIENGQFEASKALSISWWQQKTCR